MHKNSIALNQNTGALSNGADFKKSPEAIFDKLNNSINVTSKLLDEAETNKDFEQYLNLVDQKAQDLDEELDTIEDRGLETYKDHYLIRINREALNLIWHTDIFNNHYLCTISLVSNSFYELLKWRVREGIKTGNEIIDNDNFNQEAKLRLINQKQNFNKNKGRHSMRLKLELYNHHSLIKDGLVIGNWRKDKDYIYYLISQLKAIQGIYNLDNVIKLQEVSHQLDEFELKLDALEWLNQELRITARELEGQLI